jgi:hypothetical protein
MTDADDRNTREHIEDQKQFVHERGGNVEPKLRVLEAVRKAHAPALRQLRERVQVTEGHAKDAMRWLAADLPPQSEARWRLTSAQAFLMRARKALEEAERAVEEL